MQDKEKLQKYFVLGFVAFLIITLVIIFVIRFTLFKTGKYLTTLPESELLKKGYGTYKTAFSTGCLTASGKCNIGGVKYTTQYCAGNSDTGKGCLDQDGHLTFASQTITENCLPNCRSTLLNDISDNVEYSSNSSLCKYFSPYDTSEYNCIPKNVKASQYSIFNCVPNDPVGENSCNYICGSDGIGPNGISGDSDPTLSSYMPTCVGKRGNIITLNSFNWNLVGNIPNEGFKITKGYKINNFVENGINSVNKFVITPAYLPPATKTDPNPVAKAVITRAELSQIDNQLVVLENCTPDAQKPICNNLFVYSPTEVGGQFTTTNQKLLPLTPPNIFQTKSCYVSPYWNAAPSGPSGAVENYSNPYVTVPQGNGTTGLYSMLEGIGSYGITYEYQTCIPANYNLTLSGTGPDIYFMPPAYSPGSQCLSLVGATGPGPGLCFTDNNYISLPIPANSSYNICNTVFPDGARPQGWDGSTSIPGTILQCQYLPDSSTIDFTGETTGGIILDPVLQNLIGNYTQITILEIATNEAYFLGPTTTPCGTGTNSSTLQPLSNCNAINPNFTNGYNSQKCLFTYTGGDLTSPSAGAFWSRLNCDGEMISLASSFDVIVSPRTINSSTSMTCDLYGFFGTTYGQFYTEQETGYFSLYFQPMTTSEQVNPLYYRSQTFDINFDTSSSQIEITVTGSSDPIRVDSFDGRDLLNNFFEISGTTGNFALSLRKVPYYGPVIKEGGINSGSNITSVLNQQRNDQCYYNSCNPEESTLEKPCFPKSCNLYYTYNTNLC